MEQQGFSEDNQEKDKTSGCPYYSTSIWGKTSMTENKR